MTPSPRIFRTFRRRMRQQQTPDVWTLAKQLKMSPARVYRAMNPSYLGYVKFMNCTILSDWLLVSRRLNASIDELIEMIQSEVD